MLEVGDRKEQSFDIELFRNPPKEYRGKPFWAWTGKPEKTLMREQISDFSRMGFGGFFMHSRVGLDIPYLGREFMDDIRFCRDTAEEFDLLSCLYDEDKWPSGFGGGRVTQTAEFASRYLLLTPKKFDSGTVRRQAPGHTRLSDSGQLSLLRTFALKLKGGLLEAYHEVLLSEDHEKYVQSGFEIWYLYLVISEKLDWFNGERYADLLNGNTAERFLEVTYEKYHKALGSDFGKRVPVIFMDEPSLKRYEMMPDSCSPSEVGIPYSDDVNAAWREKYGAELLSVIPEIVFDCVNGNHYEFRYRYFDICSELFSTQFVGKIEKWCAERNICLTGHFQDENSLELQAKACGDVMRAMASLDIPGIDILFHNFEIFTLKQAQSVCHQFGKKQQSAELYGVTNWDFDFRGHRHQGDFAAVLGTTVRVPHLAWMSMKGEMKRDFPASINHFSPWYRKYKIIEDHFARVSVAMTGGKPIVSIAIVDPIESMWLLMGPDNKYKESRARLETGFAHICQSLLFRQLDFDLLNEALLEARVSIASGSLKVGDMTYHTVLLPGLLTLRENTLRLLLTFANSGGSIISMGELPAFVNGSGNACYSDLLRQLKEKCKIIPFSDTESLLKHLENDREISIQGSDSLLTQYREDDDSRWLFLAHGKTPAFPSEDITIQISGIYTAETYDTETGEVFSTACTYGEQSTFIKHRLYADDSLLLRLYPGKNTLISTQNPEIRASTGADTHFVAVPDLVSLTLEEKNVLILDMPQFSVDGSETEGPEEILRADDIIRRRTGYKLRSESSLQPWLDPDKSCPHRVELLYSFSSELETEGQIGIEMEQDWTVMLNDRIIPFTDRQEYYLDPVIRLSEPVPIKKGINFLRVLLPFGKRTNLERIFILGRFGVFRKDTLSRPFLGDMPEKVSFQDLSKQGYLFYSGNSTYEFDVLTQAGHCKIAIPAFAGALLEVDFDGASKNIYKVPFEAEFDRVEAGLHHVKITVYGNRFNTFGPIHDCSGSRWCYGPASFRTKGDAWTDHYCLKSAGLLSSPRITVEHI